VRGRLPTWQDSDNANKLLR